MKHRQKSRVFLLFQISVIFFLLLSCIKEKESIPVLTTDDIILENSGVIKWCLAGGKITSDGGKPVIERGVCWSTIQDPTISDNKTLDGEGSGNFSTRISGLKSLTQYFFRAYATNSLGTAYGNEVSFTTPCIMIGGIENLVINQLSPYDGASGQPTYLTLAWQSSNLFNLKFDVYFGKNVIPESIIATNQTAKSISLTDLTANTTYYWKIFAKDIDLQCNSSSSPIWSFTTLSEITLPNVSTANVMRVTNTFATVGGNVSFDGGVPVTERGIYWGTSQDPEITGTRLDIDNGTGLFEFGLSGLSPNTTYFVKAFASNSKGTSFGSQVGFTTAEAEESVTDIEGNVYHVITIASQTWMAENLKVTKYSDGTSIPYVSDLWSGMTTGAYCDYNNDPDNGIIYGHLYNFYTVIDNRKVCPSGWHIPTYSEWETLVRNLGGNSAAGCSLREAGTTHWINPNTCATNSSGFSALPGGARASNGSFNSIGAKAYWWQLGFTNPSLAWNVDLHIGLPGHPGYVQLWETNMKSGNSIRCIKD